MGKHYGEPLGWRGCRVGINLLTDQSPLKRRVLHINEEVGEILLVLLSFLVYRKWISVQFLSVTQYIAETNLI